MSYQKIAEEAVERIADQVEINLLTPSESLDLMRNWQVACPNIEGWPDKKKKLYAFIRGCCIKYDKQGSGKKAAPITLETMAGFIGEKKQKTISYRDELIDDGWIKQVGNHQSGKHGRTYKLTKKALKAKHKWIKLPKYIRKPSHKTIKEWIEKSNEKQIQNLSGIEKYIVQCMQSIQLDSNMIKNLTDKDFKNHDAWNHYQYHLNTIATKQILMSSSQYGRIYHSGNLCPKKLRSSFCYKNKRLFELDVSNMHPNLLIGYLKDFKEGLRATKGYLFRKGLRSKGIRFDWKKGSIREDIWGYKLDSTYVYTKESDNEIETADSLIRILRCEINRLTDLCKNDFYRLFYEQSEISRKEAKRAFNSYLNGATRSTDYKSDKDSIYGLNTVKELFEEEFEALTFIIGDERKKKKIGKALQQKESRIFIDHVGAWARKNNELYIPIHDAVLCLKSDIRAYEYLIKDGFKRYAGVDVTIEAKNPRTGKSVVLEHRKVAS